MIRYFWWVLLVHINSLYDSPHRIRTYTSRKIMEQPLTDIYVFSVTGFSSESSLLSPSSAMRPPSQKGVRSTGSLDRLREETKPRDFSAPLKKTSAKQQSFIPHRTSTPASKRSLSRNNDYRHSFHLSSLPEMTVTPDRPNRWSIGDMTSSLTGLGGSLPFSSSASQGSDLQRSMESELESSTESEGWPVRLISIQHDFLGTREKWRFSFWLVLLLAYLLVCVPFIVSSDIYRFANCFFLYERYHEGVPQSRPLSQTPMEPVIMIISPEGGYLISARKTLRCSSVTPSLVVNFLQLPLHTLPATTDPTSVPPENHVIPK